MHGSSVLNWEKSFYPGITCGIVTVLYVMLWWMQLSVLTTVALVALAICAGDYVLPLLLKFVFKPENWTGVQEKRYEEVCREIFNAKVQLCNLCTRFRVAKAQKSTMVCFISMAVLYKYRRRDYYYLRAICHFPVRGPCERCVVASGLDRINNEQPLPQLPTHSYPGQLSRSLQLRSGGQGEGSRRHSSQGTDGRHLQEGRLGSCVCAWQLD